MSKVESAMDILIDVFQYYSSKEGNKFQLNRGELSQFLQASRDPRRVEEIMSDLDTNMDGSVNFEEFVAMVTQLTVCSAVFFEDNIPVIIKCGYIKDGQFYAL